MAIGVAIAATASAYAAPAAWTRGFAGSRVLDSTYSCRVRAQHYFNVATSVTLPPTPLGFQRPALVSLDTAGKSGTTLPQVWFQAMEKGIKVNKSACRASSRRVPLKPGLPLYETVTPSLYGHIDVRCVSAKRVLVRLRVEMNGGKPAQALVAIRDDNPKASPVAFFNWSPLMIKGYIGSSCTDTG